MEFSFCWKSLMLASLTVAAPRGRRQCSADCTKPAREPIGSLPSLIFRKYFVLFKWVCLRIGYTQIQWLIVIFTIKTILGYPSILDKLEWLRLLIHSGVLPDDADFSCVWSEVKFSPHGCSCCQAWLVSAQPMRIHDYFRLKERSPLLRTDVNDDNRPIASNSCMPCMQYLDVLWISLNSNQPRPLQEPLASSGAQRLAREVAWRCWSRTEALEALWRMFCVSMEFKGEHKRSCFWLLFWEVISQSSGSYSYPQG